MNKSEALFDRRVQEMNFREGTISEADYAKFLKSLPDREANAVEVSILDLAPQSYLRSALGVTKQQAAEGQAGAKPETRKGQK
ncbi:MAG TPA: hypothetical protein VM658_08770 [bacterium]|nr:hypothetical protein [bacterium]